MLLCANLVGIYFRYLIEASHKQTFQDTRNCIESRVKLEHERQQQVVSIELLSYSKPASFKCIDILNYRLQLRKQKNSEIFFITKSSFNSQCHMGMKKKIKQYE